ncbi:MAG: sulfatase, partial [Candidatus Hydrogenedentes bacterium]|nr:sulfatase [Candidatus Hydrogenedentota bacterium]
SPNIDRFAAESILFEQAIVSAPWTTPSHASVFTGYHPRVHQAGVVAAGYHLGPEWTTLAEHLRDTGYLTAAFTEGVALRGSMGFAQGFDRYSDGPDPVRHYHGKSPRTFAAAGDWIEAHRNQPFFAFVHTYEIHAPYGAPEPWGRLYAERDFAFSSRLELGEAENDRDRTHVSNLYDAGIAYTDVQLGRFLQRLRELDLFENTIVILFSDHGEEFWEHGAHGHTTHLYDEVLHVPLIIHVPGGLDPGRVPEQVGVIDIYATVLDLLNLPAPEDDDSVSLVPLLRHESGYSRESVHAEFIYDGSGETALPTGEQIQVREALRTESAKYLRYSEAGAPADGPAIEEHLYDLDEDPREQADITDSAADEAARLRKALELFRQEKEAVRARHVGEGTAGGGMSQEDVDALRGLGYF